MTTRKAIRLYEAAGILPPARRTASGDRTYDAKAVRLLEFVRRAQRLRFTLIEIGEIGGEPLKFAATPHGVGASGAPQCSLRRDRAAQP